MYVSTCIRNKNSHQYSYGFQIFMSTWGSWSKISKIGASITGVRRENPQGGGVFFSASFKIYMRYRIKTPPPQFPTI